MIVVQINGRPLGSKLHLPQKENISLGNFAPQHSRPPSLQFSVPPMISAPCKPHPLLLDVHRPEFIPNPSFVSLWLRHSPRFTIAVIADRFIHL